MEFTKIQYSDHTFNAWVGCQKISAGCKNCYAEVSAPARNLRNGAVQNRKLEVWGPAPTPRYVTSEGNWNKVLRWDSESARNIRNLGRRTIVFVNSLSDVFEDHPDLPAVRSRMFDLLMECKNLSFMFFTKRPENIASMVPWKHESDAPHNMWFGASVEHDLTRSRIESLALAPVKNRFLSIEPMIGAVDLSKAKAMKVDWVIVGGESGHDARPCHLEWIVNVIDTCSPSLPVFVKQLGSKAFSRGERLALAHDKGGDILEWPSQVARRHFPSGILG